MSSKQNKNFEIVQYNFEVFVFVMIIYYTLYFSCSFYISRTYLKSFLQDCTSQFVGLWPGWGCRSELWQSNSRKIYCKAGYADREMIFKIYLRALFVLFCYFFNYALFYFIFIQSFCFNQNCLKLYFRMTIYFLEDFYGFICLFCYLQYIKQVFVVSLRCQASFIGLYRVF